VKAKGMANGNREKRTSAGRSLFDHPGFRKPTTAAGTTLPATNEDGRSPHNAKPQRALGKAMARNIRSLALKYWVPFPAKAHAGKSGAM
jgi:hypothetical protein